MHYTETEEFRTLNKRFIDTFKENLPLMMIPGIETLEGLTEKVNQSIEKGENLLPKFYNWKYDGSEIY